jgi:hypothetical protein
VFPETDAFLTGDSLVTAPAASCANSGAGIVDCEKPQSKQITSTGNTQTPGLSRFLTTPVKWMMISLGNSV